MLPASPGLLSSLHPRLLNLPALPPGEMNSSHLPLSLKGAFPLIVGETEMKTSYIRGQREAAEQSGQAWFEMLPQQWAFGKLSGPL